MRRVSYGLHYPVAVSIPIVMKVAFLIILLTVVYVYATCSAFSKESDSQSQWNFVKPSGSDNNKGISELSERPKLAPFGDILGVASKNVPAYSNGNDTFYSGQNYYLHGIYMGLKWQCVEFARRYLFKRKGCTFKEVDGAVDMWEELTDIKRVTDSQLFTLKAQPNGCRHAPKNESLLIYKRGPDMPFGHVAVIVDVVPGFVRVAEQNYNFHYWTHNYARQISLVFKDGLYYIEDKYDLYGWMEIEDNEQLKPLDKSAIENILRRN